MSRDLQPLSVWTRDSGNDHCSSVFIVVTFADDAYGPWPNAAAAATPNLIAQRIHRKECFHAISACRSYHSQPHISMAGRLIKCIWLTIECNINKLLPQTVGWDEKFCVFLAATPQTIQAQRKWQSHLHGNSVNFSFGTKVFVENMRMKTELLLINRLFSHFFFSGQEGNDGR